MNFRRRIGSVVFIVLFVSLGNSVAQQNVPSPGLRSRKGHSPVAGRPADSKLEPARREEKTPLEPAMADQAGPQKADEEGRTRLPMEVRKSVGFREIGPAISGGRVTAVAGVPGNNNIYYVGAADGGVFRTSDGGMTWKALFQRLKVKGAS